MLACRAMTSTVPIPNAILPALQWAKNETKSLYVCPNMTTGGIMSAQAYGQAWRSYMHYLNIQAGGKDRSRINPKIVAMEPFTAHQLRHSYATMLYDADVDVKTAQKLLGHADFGVTMKIYTHLSAEKETAGIEKLNEHLDQLLGRTIEDKVKER